MSNEEIVRYLNTHPSLDSYNAEDREAVQGAINIINRLEKYEWHDLRKNPDDLPVKDKNEKYSDVSVDVVVLAPNPIGSNIDIQYPIDSNNDTQFTKYIGYYIFSEKIWSLRAFRCTTDCIIAWKYI